jgi:putative IMPACT (imprinted ancient) family translation regulator
LHKTLVIVTRYYGGIQLGGGGLVSAYSATASEVLDKAGVKVFIESIVAKINLAYEQDNTVKQLVKKYEINILGTEYLEVITFKITVEQSKWQEVKNTLARLKIHVENESVCWL